MRRAVHEDEFAPRTRLAQYDFTRSGTYPRSGRVTLGGVVYLARAIDKMRAELQGTEGEYIAACPQSQRVYDFLGVTPDQFRESVRTHTGDNGVLRSLQPLSTRWPTQAVIARFNDTMLAEEAEGGLHRKLYDNLIKAGYGDRTDVTTFVDMQDVEEGRSVPRRARAQTQRAA